MPLGAPYASRITRKLNKKIPPEVLSSLASIEEPGRLADTIAAHLSLKVEDKQDLLEILDVGARLERLMAAIEGEIDGRTKSVRRAGAAIVRVGGIYEITGLTHLGDIPVDLDIFDDLILQHREPFGEIDGSRYRIVQIRIFIRLEGR